MSREHLSEEQEKARIINEVISEYFNIGINDIWKKSRKTEIVYPRQLIHFFIKEFTNMTITDIGAHSEIYGSVKDHSTVIHSCKSIRDYNEVDRDKQHEIKKIRFILKRRLFVLSQNKKKLSPEQKSLIEFRMIVLRALRLSKNKEILKAELISIL